MSNKLALEASKRGGDVDGWEKGTNPDPKKRKGGKKSRKSSVWDLEGSGDELSDEDMEDGSRGPSFNWDLEVS